jgi:hypothetical protein
LNDPHIIHNEKNLDRHFSILEQLTSQGIENYTFEPAVFKENSTAAVREAHQNIVIKNYDKEEITIFEDDIIFTSPKSWELYWEWYKELPDDWSIYLGGLYSFKRKVSISGNLYRIDGGMSGLHWYTIRKKFYDKFLECQEKFHIDRWVGHTGTPKYAPKLLPSRQAEVDFEKWAASERINRSRKVKRPANYRNWRIKHEYLK